MTERITEISNRIGYLNGKSASSRIQMVEQEHNNRVREQQMEDLQEHLIMVVTDMQTIIYSHANFQGRKENQVVRKDIQVD